jgi:hypothetical protein
MQPVARGGEANSLVRIALVVTCLLTSLTARAADPGTAPIAVVLHSESSELTHDVLDRALVEELGIPQ